MRVFVSRAGLTALVAIGTVALPSLSWSFRTEYFTPSHRLSGLGVSRGELSDELLAARTANMIESQTFPILRDPLALSGAQRIESPALQRIFRAAGERTGFPASTLAAVAYLESWGLSNAESPSGPKGIMQISEGTARRMGLQVVRATRYRFTSDRQAVKTKTHQTVYKVVRRRTAYTVTVRDDRLAPTLAVPAAAKYLSHLESNFGARDWAIFAYHCGEGCVSDLIATADQAHLDKSHQPSVARTFFSVSPVLHRDLNEEIERHMQRDYSPTYWFRVMRAEQLLDLYKSEPAQFKKLYDEYRYEVNPSLRAPHRLALWLKASDVSFRSRDDLKRAQGKQLVRVLENPAFYGFDLRKRLFDASNPREQEDYFQASPSAIGTLLYIAFETRRLHEALKPRGEKFVPLPVTSLVLPLDYEQQHWTPTPNFEAPSHCTGMVFDIAYAQLPAGERECLQFVLDDMGWDGYLGFIDESVESGVMHIGCSPSSREFFTAVYRDAIAEKPAD